MSDSDSQKVSTDLGQVFEQIAEQQEALLRRRANQIEANRQQQEAAERDIMRRRRNRIQSIASAGGVALEGSAATVLAKQVEVDEFNIRSQTEAARDEAKMLRWQARNAIISGQNMAAGHSASSGMQPATFDLGFAEARPRGPLVLKV